MAPVCYRSALALLVAATAADPHAQASGAALLAGNRLYAAGDLAGARGRYEACLQAEPANGLCLTNLASVLLDLAPGEPEARGLAERLYRRVVAEHGVAASGLGADAAFNLGLLLQDERTLESTAEACGLYGRVAGAQAAAGEAPRWDVLANLASCTHDLRADPARAFELFAAAIVAGEAMEEAAPGAGGGVGRAELGGALAALYRGLGTLLAEADAALCAALVALDAGPRGRRVLLLPGPEEEEGGDDVAACAANGRNALQRALELDPSDAQAAHALAALSAAAGGGGGGGAPGPDRASPEFVRALFDDFAPTFDAQLASLGYAVPQIVGRAVAGLVASERRGAPFASALDAGCGTGLLGPELRPSVDGPLVGVDLSANMLQRAAALAAGPGRPVYDALLESDLLALGQPGRGLPLGLSADGGVGLVAAGDVLVYFGALGALLGALGGLLAPADGRLVFSCEALEHAGLSGGAADAAREAGWALTASGRYAHSAAYVEAAAWEAARLRVLAHAEIVPRVDRGVEVRGHLFVLGRAAAD